MLLGIRFQRKQNGSKGPICEAKMAPRLPQTSPRPAKAGPGGTDMALIKTQDAYFLENMFGNHSII